MEIKTFAGASKIAALEEAIGQYVLYRMALRRTEPERELYIAAFGGVLPQDRSELRLLQPVPRTRRPPCRPRSTVMAATTESEREIADKVTVQLPILSLARDAINIFAPSLNTYEHYFGRSKDLDREIL